MKKLPSKASPPYFVVGAGAQGLTFALSLALKGLPVVLVERSRAVGGFARSFHYGRFTFDFGMHAFVSRDPRVLSFVRRVLGEDYSATQASAGTCLEGGAVVEDSSLWRSGASSRSLYSLWGGGGGDGRQWNCMLIAKPPQIVYPRRGGFGRLAASMAEMLRARGGRIVLGRTLSADDFEVAGDRIASVRMGARRVAARGCFWAAGDPAGLLARAPDAPRDSLILFHFLVRGQPVVRHHWVRLPGSPEGLMPRLVYFTTRFSPANAPRGFHGVGAAIPVAASSPVAGGSRLMAEWLRQEPATFAPLIREKLCRAGLMRDGDVLDARAEVLPLPAESSASGAPHPFDGLVNFWDARRWIGRDPAESAVALQMSGALDAVEAVVGPGTRARKE